jgi:hypothetical protein
MVRISSPFMSGDVCSDDSGLSSEIRALFPLIERPFLMTINSFLKGDYNIYFIGKLDRKPKHGNC